jgi:hypothetical protein
MNDLYLFIAGGLYVFIVAFLVASVEHLKTKFKDKE